MRSRPNRGECEVIARGGGGVGGSGGGDDGDASGSGGGGGGCHNQSGRRRRRCRPDHRRQHPAAPARHPPCRKVATLEYSAPWVAGAWLLAWVINNIGVNILNKSAFQFVDFPYPYALSAVHMLCNYLGAEVYYAVKKSAPQRKVLSPEQYKVRDRGVYC